MEIKLLHVGKEQCSGLLPLQSAIYLNMSNSQYKFLFSAKRCKDQQFLKEYILPQLLEVYIAQHVSQPTFPQTPKQNWASSYSSRTI